jgi:hypothetical protein
MKLGEQWIEIIDGHEHMVKCIDIETGVYPQTNFYKYGILIKTELCEEKKNFWNRYTLKDLGILNEDGCLTNCWGEYPEIEELVDVHTREHWFRCITRNNVYCATESYKTKQQAIDAWNRRS